MPDQGATPSALCCVSDDIESDMDIESDTGDHQSTPDDSYQNGERLQTYMSPPETSPDHEIHEDHTYHHENHQHQFPETPGKWQATTDIYGNNEHELREALKSLKDEQKYINEQQTDVNRKRTVFSATLFNYVYEKIRNVESELASCSSLVKECEGEHFTVPKNLTTQGSPSRDCIPQHDLKNILDNAHQVVRSIQALMQGIDQTPTPTRAWFQAQGNGPVPLSACQNTDDIGIGNGTNHSGLTEELNSFAFSTTFPTTFPDIGTTGAEAGNNSGNVSLQFLHQQAPNFGNGNMMSNTGQLCTPILPMGKWGQPGPPCDSREKEVALLVSQS